MKKGTRSKDYRRLIQSQKWVRLRREYLGTHPLCEDCLAQGVSKLAQCVHHVRPIESATGHPQLMETLAYDWNNLRALCYPCHAEAHRLLRSASIEVKRERSAEHLQGFVAKYLDRGDN